MSVGVIQSLGERHHSTISVGATAVRLAPQRPNRKALILQNLGASVVSIGPATVSTSGTNQGLTLAGGAMLIDTWSSDEWWGVAATGTINIHICEIV
jgi:hypothetical protein